MSVELILIEDVADLGKIGDQVHVAEGYARNYLIPRKKAEYVTTGALKRIEAKKLRLQKELMVSTALHRASRRFTGHHEASWRHRSARFW